MSTDVYLDVAPTRGALDGDPPNAWVDSLRIGHLGLVGIATRDENGERASLLGALRLLTLACPTMNEATACLIGSLVAAHRAALNAMRAAGLRSYEYGTPVAEDDGHDVTLLDAVVVTQWLGRHKSPAWRVRVD